MTLVGKILVVLIFIMSLVFMSFTLAVYSTHRNWKDLVENPNTGLKARLTQKEQQLRQKENEKQEALNKLAYERATRTEALAVLEVKLSELTAELARNEESLRTTQTQLGEANQVVSSSLAQKQRLTEEVTKLREEVKGAREDRDFQVAEVQKLTDRINQSQGQLRRLRDRNNQLTGELGRAQVLLDSNDLDLNAPLDGQPPRLDGVVTAVRQRDLVEVSLGADEGVRRGHKLDIYAGSGAYLGRLEVVETAPDRAVGRVVPQYSQGVIRKGDRVATKLL
ncbi:MAG: hypothetical protein AAGF97_00815 [Planctomycetota bacterium]